MDLNARNILVDPSSLTVTGIVDWESAGSYPEETDVFKLCVPAVLDSALACTGLILRSFPFVYVCACSCRYLMSGGGKERDTFLADVSAACGASPPGAARRQALFDINKLADDIVWPTGGKRVPDTLAPSCMYVRVLTNVRWWW